MRGEKVPLDAEVFVGLKKKIEEMLRNFKSVKIELPRSMLFAQESITDIDLDVFANARIFANCAAVYVVMYQPNTVANFQTEYYNSKTYTNFNSHGRQFSTECKISIRKSKRKINHLLDRHHSRTRKETTVGLLEIE